MQKVDYTFPEKTVSIFFGGDFSYLEKSFPNKSLILLTDDNVHSLHKEKFSDKKVIILPSGEKFKQQSTVDGVIDQLIVLNADRNIILVGVGGGVVTDITGYVASVYLRGISFCLIPTTILAMVDAAIGGKNGVDVGVYKNIVGTVKQPELLIYDYSLLASLPMSEWINGFAEIIKHACIKDAELFNQLEKTTLEELKSNPAEMDLLIQKNVHIKLQVVLSDPFEKGDRRLLNFGHTIGHAIENIYELPHGYAVSIGMVEACKMSRACNDLSEIDAERISGLLKKYHLPVQFKFDTLQVREMLIHDKKRVGNEILEIVLNGIGNALIIPVKLDDFIADILP